MQTIGIGELQKNTSILTNLTGALEIVDRRKKESVAMVYPVRKDSVITKLAGKYRDRVQVVDDLEFAKESAMREAMREKYDLSN